MPGALSGLGAVGRRLGTRRTLALALGVPALLGTACLVVSDFEPLLHIRTDSVTLRTVTGGSNHAYAMVVLGLASLPMAVGANLGRSRPAAIGLIALAVGALAIALLGDLPNTVSTGVYGRDYESATASAAIGFFLECAGAVLLLLAGVGQLVLGDGRAAQHQHREAWE